MKNIIPRLLSWKLNNIIDPHLDTPPCKWESVVTVWDEYWIIDLPLASHKNRQKAANKAGYEEFCQAPCPVEFLIVKDILGERPAIRVKLHDGLHLYFDNDIVITEANPLTLENYSSRGKHLDMAELARLNNIYKRVNYSEYDSLVSSNKTLEYFLNRYGAGYKPENIIYGVRKIHNTTRA